MSATELHADGSRQILRDNGYQQFTLDPSPCRVRCMGCPGSIPGHPEHGSQ